MNSGAPFLNRLPLFADVAPETIARFEPRMRRREFAVSSSCGIIEQSDSGIDFVTLSLEIDPRVLRLLPQAVVNEQKIVHISFANNRLTLAVTNPSNIVAFDDVRRVIKGVLIEPAVVTEDAPGASQAGAAQVDLLVSGI